MFTLLTIYFQHKNPRSIAFNWFWKGCCCFLLSSFPDETRCLMSHDFFFRSRIPRTLQSVAALRLAGAPGLPETRMTLLLTTSAEGLPVGLLRENQSVAKFILMLNNWARDERRKKTGSSKPRVRGFRVPEVKSQSFCLPSLLSSCDRDLKPTAVQIRFLPGLNHIHNYCSCWEWSWMSIFFWW